MTQKKEANPVSVNFAVFVHTFNVAIYYYILAKITLVSLQVRYVFSWGEEGGGGRGLRPQRGGSSVKVDTQSRGSYIFVSHSRGMSHTFSRIF